jgi:hypothetical protein
MTIRPIALLTLAALLLPTITHAQTVAVPGTADVDPRCYDGPTTCAALIRSRSLAAGQPDTPTLDKTADPGTAITQVGIQSDDDGVLRWHIGVTQGGCGVEASPAAQARIRAAFAKKSTAPVVFEVPPDDDQCQ